MTATIQDSRLKRRFELWDSNGDGAIDKSDYENEAKRILKAFGEQESSIKGRALLSAYREMWDKLVDRADVSRDGAVSFDEFQNVGEQELIQGGNAGFDRSLRPTIEAIANICDTDGDGRISPPEFKRWMKAMNVDEQAADTAFKKIDTDRDGALTVEEIVAALRDYHQGKNDIPLLGA
ncbi:EF-hand domain-containing protein [Actinokineospora sp. NPDC004072]